MNGGPVIALIAASVSPENRGLEEEEIGLWAAITVLRAVLERGGRALLSTESPYLVPLLMAAAEYQEPRRVETPEETAPPPVILGPRMEMDSLEDEILRVLIRREESPEPSTLLGDLEGSGLFERGRGTFGALLAENQPRGIIAVGESARTAPFLVEAEAYRAQKRHGPVQLLRVLAGGDWWQWESIRPVERLTPPMLDGELVGELQDERLAALARRAAEEASLTLAIDRAVAALMGEPMT